MEAHAHLLSRPVEQRLLAHIEALDVPSARLVTRLLMPPACIFPAGPADPLAVTLRLLMFQPARLGWSKCCLFHLRVTFGHHYRLVPAPFSFCKRCDSSWVIGDGRMDAQQQLGQMLGAGPQQANSDGPLPLNHFARQRPSEREKPPPSLGERASAQGSFDIDDSLFGSPDDVELDKSNVLMLGPTGQS